MTTAADDRSTPEVTTVEPVTTAVVRGTISASEVTEFFDRSFGVLSAALAAQGVTPAGPAFALYRGIPDETMDLEVGFPTGRAIEPDGAAEFGELPGGQVARVVHPGAFDDLGEAWQGLGEWIESEGLQPHPSAVFWEVYLTEPNPQLDPAELRTELNWLLAP